MKQPISKSQHKRIQTQKGANISPRTSSSLSRSSSSDDDSSLRGFAETVSNIFQSDDCDTGSVDSGSGGCDSD